MYLNFSDAAKFADIAKNLLNGLGYGSNFSFWSPEVFGLLKDKIFSYASSEDRCSCFTLALQSAWCFSLAPIPLVFKRPHPKPSGFWPASPQPLSRGERGYINDKQHLTPPSPLGEGGRGDEVETLGEGGLGDEVRDHGIVGACRRSIVKANFLIYFCFP